MKEKTYEMIFYHKNGEKDTRLEYASLKDALAAFKRFVDEQSAAHYSGITLMEHDREANTDRIVGALAF